MRLVIQGQRVLPEHLAHIARLGGSAPAQIGENAYCLPVSQSLPEVATWCEAQQLDCAFVPDAMHLDSIGLVVMDMDSTLIAIECIDEIADMYGLKPQVAEITECAMRGEIEFAESLRRRVALLQGLDEGALQRVYDERLRLNPGAEFMLAQLKQHGIRTLLVSGGFVFFTDRLKARLGLDYAQSNTLEIRDGKLTGKVLGHIVDAQVKADALNRVRAELGLAKAQVIAIGDGANDLRMMSEAGAGIAYHAKPVVRVQATYALNHVGLEGVIGLLRKP
jgi:phosphoserine phosphatase